MIQDIKDVVINKQSSDVVAADSVEEQKSFLTGGIFNFKNISFIEESFTGIVFVSFRENDRVDINNINLPEHFSARH
jgi:hypothetical protein